MTGTDFIDDSINRRNRALVATSQSLSRRAAQHVIADLLLRLFVEDPRSLWEQSHVRVFFVMMFDRVTNRLDAPP